MMSLQADRHAALRRVRVLPLLMSCPSGGATKGNALALSMDISGFCLRSSTGRGICAFLMDAASDRETLTYPDCIFSTGKRKENWHG